MDALPHIPNSGSTLKKSEDMIEVTNNPNDPRELFVKVKMPLNLVKVTFSMNIKRKYKKIIGQQFQQITPFVIKDFGPGFTIRTEKVFFADPIKIYKSPYKAAPYCVRPMAPHPLMDKKSYLTYHKLRKYFEPC